MPWTRDVPGAMTCAAKLLAQGYTFGKGKTPVHPITAPWPMPCSGASWRAQARPVPPFAKRWRSTGGPPLEAPYDDLARQIGQAAYKVTDEQVARVVEGREVSGPRSSSLYRPWAPVCIAGGAVSRRWRRAEVST